MAEQEGRKPERRRPTSQESRTGSRRTGSPSSSRDAATPSPRGTGADRQDGSRSSRPVRRDTQGGSRADRSDSGRDQARQPRRAGDSSSRPPREDGSRSSRPVRRDAQGGSRTDRSDSGRDQARQPRRAGDSSSRPPREDGSQTRPSQQARGSGGRSNGFGSRGPVSRGGTRAPGRTQPDARPSVLRIDADATLDLLDRATQNELRALDDVQRERVAGHLVMAGRNLEDDPETALAHAQAASARASRLAVVREACGIAAYACGQWEQAIRELKAAMRISGSVDFLPLVADCERGLGRPERAIALAGSPEVARLSSAGRIEMRIVAAGARADQGQIDAAVVTLKCPELADRAVHEWSVSLWYAYADMLVRAGRVAEAVPWFAKAAEADVEDETDAAQRLQDLLD